MATIKVARDSGRGSVVASALLFAAMWACGGDVVPDEQATATASRDASLAVQQTEAVPELRDEPAEEAPTEGTPANAAPPPAPSSVAPSASPEPERTPVSPEPETAEPEATEAQTDAQPEPRYEEFTAPAGDVLTVRLRQELSTGSSRPGDIFVTSVVDGLITGRFVVLPRGALVRGEVTAVQKSGGRGEPAVIKVNMFEVYLEAETYPLSATVIDADPETEGRYSTGDKALRIGGGAGAGAIVGGIIGDATGALIGAAVGAAAGTAITLATEDVDAVLPVGSILTLRLDEPLTMRAIR